MEDKDKLNKIKLSNICITGLGLIGGSIGKALKNNLCNLDTDVLNIYGLDSSEEVLNNAISDGVINKKIGSDFSGYNTIDLLIISIFPRDTINYILDVIPKLKRGCIIVDCAGVKSAVINAIQQKALEYGVIFIGGHPMAGREVTGYESSLPDLFGRASMLLVPNLSSNQESIEVLSAFFTQIGFKKIILCTAEEHDRIIAYTSQLAHVVSNSYVKSKMIEKHEGYSAGSYKDMTRVAYLNEVVWEELFMLNKDFLVKEIDEFLANLTEMRDCIEQGNSEKLLELLKTGKDLKDLYK
ncbi:MAG: prephenate dehydrogenase [bacterium]